MESSEMLTAMVMVKEPGGRNWKGLGSHQFRAIPRIGETIGMDDEEGIGQHYEVVGVHHPLDPASHAGDVYAVRVGEATDDIKRLFEESPTAR